MRKDKLLKLADFLETVPAQSFDIRSWQKSAPSNPEGANPGECGFAGCAMGWAAHEGMFPGLRFGTGLDGEWSDEIYYLPDGRRPTYRDSGYFAAKQVFDFDTVWAAHYLFDGGTYPYTDREVSPAVVAGRIRKFVKDAGAA